VDAPTRPRVVLGGGYPLVLPLPQECEGSVGMSLQVEQELPESVGHVDPGEDSAPSLGYVPYSIMHLGRALGVQVCVSIDSPKVLNDIVPDKA
jgi:hypothetical protein